MLCLWWSCFKDSILTGGAKCLGAWWRQFCKFHT